MEMALLNPTTILQKPQKQQPTAQQLPKQLQQKKATIQNIFDAK